MKAIALYLFVALLSRCQKVMGCMWFVLVVLLVVVVVGMRSAIEILTNNVVVEIAVVVVVEIVGFCRLMDWFPLSTSFEELVVDWEGYTYVRNDLTHYKFCMLCFVSDH